MVHFLSFLDVRDRWTLNLSAVWDHREQPFQVRGVHNKRRLQSALGYQTATAYPWRRPTSATATRVQRRCPTIRARSSPARPIGGDRFVMRSTRNAARRASSRPPCGDPTNGKHWRGSRPGTSRSIGCTVGSKRIFGTWKRSYNLRRRQSRDLARASNQVRLTAIAYSAQAQHLDVSMPSRQVCLSGDTSRLFAMRFSFP